MENADKNDFLNIILKKLLSVKGKKPGTRVNLSEKQLIFLCTESRKILLNQPNLLNLSSPLKICGDIHGQFYDLLRIFQITGNPSNTNYLFLGDYVDRGKQNIETISLLLAFKIKFPETFFLLRGNHESNSVNRIYGFYDECKRRYNIKIWKIFGSLFDCLPVAAIIENKIFCVHGGLSPDLKKLEQINKIPRPIVVGEEGLLCDLLWSDPLKDCQGWSFNSRGVSYIFGEDIINEFLVGNNLDLICRAHQVVEDGYEFFGDRKLVTIFSAPNYCGEFDNSGGIMFVNEKLICSFQILKPSENIKANYDK